MTQLPVLPVIKTKKKFQIILSTLFPSQAEEEPGLLEPENNSIMKGNSIMLNA
jgi:hypothetical protein